MVNYQPLLEVFKAALIGGKHEIIKIGKAEFDALPAKVRED